MTYLKCLENITDFESAKQILQSKNLVIKEYQTPDLYLVKYDKSKSDMQDEDVQKCRGIILSKKDNSIICSVPPKSRSNLDFIKNFTSNPSQYSVMDFPDGTMINVFTYEGITYITTRSCLGAMCRWMSSSTFSEMFSQCLDHTNTTLDSLDKNFCYSFIIQHPSNTIVKKYLQPSLILTHVSRVENGKVTFYDVRKFVTEKEYQLRTPTSYANFTHIEEIYQYVSSMESCEQGIVILNTNIEDTYSRCKIRNIKYNMIRNLRGDTNNKQYLFFSLRKAANGSYQNYVNFFEEDKELFEYYRKELYGFTNYLFKLYLDCFVNKIDGKSVKMHKHIDYEFKPLVAELHAQYMKTRNKTTKNTVIQYLHNLPIPRLLYTINYKRNMISQQNAGNVDVANVDVANVDVANANDANADVANDDANDAGNAENADGNADVNVDGNADVNVDGNADVNVAAD